jgi:TolB-like protein
MNRLAPPLLLALCLLLTACTSIQSSAPAGLDRSARWVSLPFANNTETPLAASRAESITEGLLRARGIADLTRYPGAMAGETLFEPAERKTREQALAWAKSHGARYAITGSVDEWRYKVGVDGEPAVGVALDVIDVGSGSVLWSGVGGKSGWSREALAAVAQKLIGQLLDQALPAK